MNCKNCNQVTNGNFCSNCGQSTKVDKINLSNFLKELSESIFQINRGFFYTMKALFVSPGHSIRAYLNGKRKNHFKPIAYVFTLSTLYFILSQFLDSETFLNDFTKGFANGANDSEEDAKQLAMLDWFAKHYAYTILLLLPVYTFASYLAFFKTKFNYLEHFVLNAYIIGQQAIFYSLFSILNLMVTNDDFLAIITLCCSIFYAFFVFWQFFSKQSRVAVILRSILTYVLYLILILPIMLLFLFFAIQ